ncbi:unnamed protein product [Bursaphelenchus okinawaensis]|uniref:Ig-like domain-containing protein n=1 Tax=Bursaphelenchus okinawaensis TaxID=465554 RepID=A0A811K3H9_9BILA|nr:unnamed protein product [Bursaphelenchus okinawaensis]CAG9091173.1 unnamed protein product [Bursaphelenchus okinawaensis]
MHWVAVCLLLVIACYANERRTKELLVPINSVTPLLCEPIFNDENAKAVWYKDGDKLGTVTGRSNFISNGKQLYMKENIPEVGFLIIPHVTLEDQGEYWCERVDNKVQSDISRIRLAYLHKLTAEKQIKVWPDKPELGMSVTLTCPDTQAYPEVTIGWKKNNEPIEFSSGRYEVIHNGSLIITRFTNEDEGLYECVISNFADQTSVKVHLSSPGIIPLANTVFHYTRASSCTNWTRNNIFWFLVGCLTTSFIVLVYLLAGMICYKHSNRRQTTFSLLYSFLRADPSLAPGFRKVVVPSADVIRDPNHNGFMQEV